MNSPHKNTLLIQPGAIAENYWSDLWLYRELFLVLAWRDISVRYKQTVIGFAWALVQPILTMVVFTFVFGNLAKLPSEKGVPYALMVFAGMMPWQFMAGALGGISGSLLGNANLISKVYFPRMIVPASAVVVAFVDFIIGFGILLAMILWFRFLPSWHIIFLPCFFIMAFLASIGPGLWAASLNVKYRDFRYIVPFLIQFGLYVSPVGFSSTIVPEKWRLLYSLNPAVGVIDGFRWALLGGEAKIYMPGFILSWVVILLFLYFGVQHFRRVERIFADQV